MVGARLLDPAPYAPYGGVVMASPRGEPGTIANNGTARRFDRLAELVSLRPHATPNLSLFRATPNPERPVPIRMLEKHPMSTQLFVPMNATRYLVVVARGGERPDVGTLSAFVARGKQAITYAPGVWHHPIIALDNEIDFACLVWEDGGADDCVAKSLSEEVRVDLSL